MIANRKIKSIWKELIESSVPIAVFLFEHGVEVLALRDEAYHSQLDKMINDFINNFVGVYSNSIPLEYLAEDLAFVGEQVSLSPATYQSLFRG